MNASRRIQPGDMGSVHEWDRAYNVTVIETNPTDSVVRVQDVLGNVKVFTRRTSGRLVESKRAKDGPELRIGEVV